MNTNNVTRPVDVLAVEWSRAPGTPNYASDCGQFVAIYKNTSRCGLGANYWTFPANTPKRQQTSTRAIAFGGLPQRLPAALAKFGGAK